MVRRRAGRDDHIEFLQSDHAIELLRAALAEYTPDLAQLAVVSHRELTSAIGRRRVIGYTVEGLDPAGPTQLIAKIFTSPAALSCCGPTCRSSPVAGFAVGRFRVPEVLTFLPDESLVLYRACIGIPLNELLDNEGWLDGVRDAARWLATLHTSAVQLPRTFVVEREVVSTQEWAAVIGRHRPQLLEPAQRLASQWAAFGPPEPSGTRFRFTRTSTPHTC